MKVAIVQEHIDPQRGGAETSVLEMAAALAALGLDITVVCARRAHMRPVETITDRARVEAIEVTGPGRLLRTRQFVTRAEGFVRREGFDVVHAVAPCRFCHVYQPRGGLYVETVARSVARSRTVAGRWLRRIGRRLNQRQRFLLRLEQALLDSPHPPQIAAVSQYVCHQVRRHFPNVPNSHLHLIPNGVSVNVPTGAATEALRCETRRRLGAGRDERLLLFVAHNFALKGLGELIDACASLAPDVPWRLLVAGRDNPRPYRRQARRAGIETRVQFLGSVDVGPLYAAADALAHPTWYDPCSRVVLEALCWGLPVVTTRCNGACDAMTDESFGIIVDDPADTQALRHALQRVLRWPRIDAQHTAHLHHKLSITRHAHQLMALYGSISGCPPANRAGESRWSAAERSRPTPNCS